MKHSSIAGNVFAIAAALAITLTFSPAAKGDDKGCSNASLNGTFAYSANGYIVSPAVVAGPITEVGTQVFDGKGATNATAILSQNGNIVPLTITGSYVVNSDCTGTATLQVAPIGITVHVFFVLDDSGAGFQAIETDAGLVVSRVGRRLFPGRNI